MKHIKQTTVQFRKHTSLLTRQTERLPKFDKDRICGKSSHFTVISNNRGSVLQTSLSTLQGLTKGQRRRALRWNGVFEHFWIRFSLEARFREGIKQFEARNSKVEIQSERSLMSELKGLRISQLALSQQC